MPGADEGICFSLPMQHDTDTDRRVLLCLERCGRGIVHVNHITGVLNSAIDAAGMGGEFFADLLLLTDQDDRKPVARFLERFGCSRHDSGRCMIASHGIYGDTYV